MILIIGSDTWMGSIIKKYFTNKTNETICELNTYDNLENDISHNIKNNNVTSIICTVEKSYGKNIYNTSFIENKLHDNVYYNLQIPILIASLCKKYDIFCTFITNGCIYKSCDEMIDEKTVPNLFVSNHSTICITKENILDTVNNNCLNLRLRYPITGDFNPMCYLSKLISYDKVLNCNNSVSIIPDLLPIIFLLIKNKIIGTYNLTNTGSLNSHELLIKYKYNIDSNIKISEMSQFEHDSYVGQRSNNIVSNEKLINEINKINENNNLDNNLDNLDNNLDNSLNTQNSIDNLINKMTDYCKELKQCLCCKVNGTLNTVLNLGYQPLANNFHDFNEYCNYYPLHLKYCNNCYHCQLSHAVNPDILFKNYKYVSGTSQTGLNFFKENAIMIDKLFTNNKNKKILDIACNDGSQLNCFKELNWDTYGIDPATNLCPIAEKQGHHITCDYFNENTAKQYYVNNNIIFDVITAQNVFAHTEFIDSFLQGCKLIMNDNSSLFIQTSQRDMIINNEFDTTYHEHISFYSTKSMRVLVDRNGLILYKVREHSIHGRSYIFEIKLKNDKNELIELPEEKQEEILGLYNPIMYEKFNLNANKCVMNLKNLIKTYSEKKYKIIGFGAAAKGQTLLCYSNIELDYIIDENSLKIGTYSPKLDIPVVSIKHFEKNFVTNNDTKFVVLILAWNFAEEICKKIESIDNFDKDRIIFIKKYFPDIIIY